MDAEKLVDALLPGRLEDEIFLHIQKYDVADARRRYTPAQVITAMHLAIRATAPAIIKAAKAEACADGWGIAK